MGDGVWLAASTFIQCYLKHSAMENGGNNVMVCKCTECVEHGYIAKYLILMSKEGRRDHIYTQKDNWYAH